MRLHFSLRSQVVCRVRFSELAHGSFRPRHTNVANSEESKFVLNQRGHLASRVLRASSCRCAYARGDNLLLGSKITSLDREGFPVAGTFFVRIIFGLSSEFATQSHNRVRRYTYSTLKKYCELQGRSKRRNYTPVMASLE